MLTEYSMEQLEQRIGYVFRNRSLLEQALTHSSFANEQKINRKKDYERLEFLGDAVLELVTSTFLFGEYPDMPEGEMTRRRSMLVCEPALAFCAKDIELGRYILLGKGEEATGGRERDSITSDVMEAVIGAIYEDSGFEAAGSFIRRFILSDLENKQLFYDSKTLLQEMIQKQAEGTLEYRLIEESGPDHDKQFVVDAVINGVASGRGTGRTKKAAEQKAAYEVLLKRKKDKEKR